MCGGELNGGGTRRAFLSKGALTTVAAAPGSWRLLDPASAEAAPPAAHAAVVGSPPLTDAGYWEFADWLQPAMDRLWSDSLHVYTNDTRLNSSALMTHSIAAFTGHDGQSRNDGRARQLAERLCESPAPFRVPRNGRPTRHSDPRHRQDRVGGDLRALVSGESESEAVCSCFAWQAGPAVVARGAPQTSQTATAGASRRAFSVAVLRSASGV